MAYLKSEAFGADKGEEAGAYDGFKDHDNEECEDVEDDQTEEGPEQGWGLAIKSPFTRFRKSCIRKDSQCIFASFCKYAFAEILRFRQFSQICFRRL